MRFFINYCVIWPEHSIILLFLCSHTKGTEPNQFYCRLFYLIICPSSFLVTLFLFAFSFCPKSEVSIVSETLSDYLVLEGQKVVLIICKRDCIFAMFSKSYGGIQ